MCVGLIACGRCSTGVGLVRVTLSAVLLSPGQLIKARAAFELEFQRHRAVRQPPWRRAHRYLQCMDTFTTDLDVQSHVIYDLPHLHRWSLRKVHKSAPTAPPALSASIVIPQVELTSAIERPSRAMFQTTPVTPWGLTAVHASTSATASDWHNQMDETSLPVYQTHICG